MYPAGRAFPLKDGSSSRAFRLQGTIRRTRNEDTLNVIDPFMRAWYPLSCIVRAAAPVGMSLAGSGPALVGDRA